MGKVQALRSLRIQHESLALCVKAFEEYVIE